MGSYGMLELMEYPKKLSDTATVYVLFPQITAHQDDLELSVRSRVRAYTRKLDARSALASMGQAAVGLYWGLVMFAPGEKLPERYQQFPELDINGVCKANKIKAKKSIEMFDNLMQLSPWCEFRDSTEQEKNTKDFGGTLLIDHRTNN